MATGNIPDQLKGHVGHAYFKHPVFSENQIKWLALTKIWHLIFLFLILYVNLKWSIPLPSLRFDVEKEKVRKIYDFRLAVHVIFSTPVTHVFTRQDEGMENPLIVKALSVIVYKHKQSRCHIVCWILSRRFVLWDMNEPSKYVFIQTKQVIKLFENFSQSTRS